MKDGSVKHGIIKCKTCGDGFIVDNIKIKENKFLKNYLESEHHLSNEEKQIKNEIHDLFKQFQELSTQYSVDQGNIESDLHKHFAEIKRQIDIQRETLKEKIDTIALDLIKSANIIAKTHTI